MAPTIRCLVALCALPAVLAEDHTIWLMSGGRNRTALVHLPPASGALPLVLNFHTLCEDGPSEAALTHMSDLADREGFIVAYPNGAVKGSVEGWFPNVGVGLSWNGGTCCPGASADAVDDVQFARDLLAHLADDNGSGGGAVAALSGGARRVDETRRFATGASNGAFLVNRIACEAPELFRA